MAALLSGAVTTASISPAMARSAPRRTASTAARPPSALSTPIGHPAGSPFARSSTVTVPGAYRPSAGDATISPGAYRPSAGDATIS